MSNATNNLNNASETMNTIEVTGRNGYIYDATHITDNLYIVGKFIVKVEDGQAVRTLCRATKANVRLAERRVLCAT